MHQAQQTATVSNRLLAFALDYLVIASYLVGLALLGFLVSQIFPTSQRFFFRTASSAQATGFVLVTLPISLYFVLLEARGSTLGKRQRGLSVRCLNGQALGLRLSVQRTALKFLPWELSHTCIWQLRFEQLPSDVIVAGFILVWVLVGGNVLSLLTNVRHQTLYDKILGTVVIDARRTSL
jgi:uncharacterized RDD family membrane protein YckC